MEFKRRRMIKSEIDRLLSDEGTRNLLSGIKVLSKSKKLTRIVTRNNRLPRKTINNNNNNNKDKTKQIIKKSLSLLGHHTKITNGTGGGNERRGTTSGGSGGGNQIKLNGGVTVSTKVPNHNPAPTQPLLATLIRDHVAFITLSYHNHLCVLKTQDLRDLVRKLDEYESRKGISVIVLNSSSDRIFCDGLDYKELIHSDLNKRKHAVQHRISCIKNFLNALAKSKKLLVASVNGGKVNGFGVMILSLFDVVYANDKATFSLQKYFQLKQPPEGISTFNQGQLQHVVMKSLVYNGRVFTASEMQENSFLVTELLWDGSRYHEQLASKLQHINSHEYTKSIYKTYSSKNTKQVSSDLAHEFSILESMWMSDSWQTNFLQMQQRDSQ